MVGYILPMNVYHTWRSVIVSCTWLLIQKLISFRPHREETSLFLSVTWVCVIPWKMSHYKLYIQEFIFRKLVPLGILDYMGMKRILRYFTFYDEGCTFDSLSTRWQFPGRWSGCGNFKLILLLSVEDNICYFPYWLSLMT